MFKTLLIIFVSLVALFFSTSCGDYKWTNPLDRNNDLEDVAQPVLTPSGNTYVVAQTVSITCATQDAAIYYTLDVQNQANRPISIVNRSLFLLI